jgi:DNA-binding NarL/FixJ family response regulator
LALAHEGQGVRRRRSSRLPRRGVFALKRRPEFDVVGAGEDGGEALDAICELGPDVALLDVNMPGLHLSPETVKTHLKNVYEKLDVSDRAAAVAEGMRRGLVE